MPIVLYTGERSWGNIQSLAEVIEAGKLFEPMIPSFRPHFLNLRDTPSEKLTREGGFFGQILWLVRDRHAEPAAFRRILAHVVAELEQMPPIERTRWIEFLSSILALVYHARSAEEQGELRELVDSSVHSDPHRREFLSMGKTIAEMYIDQGKQQGELAMAKSTLLLQLRKRFKKVPRKIELRIKSTTNLSDLEAWLANFANAKTLAGVGIPADD